MLRVLPPSCTTNFYVATRRGRFYSLQHGNLVAQEGDNTRNKPSQLATQNCCATSCTKNVARITVSLQWPQDKIKTMLMQILEEQTKSI